MRGVAEIDEASKDAADGIAAIADQRDRDGIGLLQRLNDIAQAELFLLGQNGREPLTPSGARFDLGSSGNRSSACVGLEAAAIAAIAKLHMADISVANLACMFRGAAVNNTITDDAGAYAIADLDED